MAPERCRVVGKGGNLEKHTREMEAWGARGYGERTASGPINKLAVNQVQNGTDMQAQREELRPNSHPP